MRDFAVVRVASVVLAVVVAAAATPGSAAPRPAPAAGLPQAAPLPPPRPDRAPPIAAPARPASLPAQDEAADIDPGCLAALDRLAVAYERLPALSDGSCGAPAPLKVSRLPDGVAVTPPSTMTCGTAQALARWVLDVVVPEADLAFGKPALAVQIGTSYECRSQNRREGAKLSEHAFAGAVDVMGFAFGSDKTVAVGPLPPESPEARFHAAVRAGACRYFTTVLGPGSDPEHATHFHLDVRARKGFRICQ
jgi:hypothetical protein